MTERASTLLLHGIDTLQCAYYLRQEQPGDFDFAQLLQSRESLRQLGRREGQPITLGGVPFLLHPHGTRSGYPFLLTSEDFRVECGEFLSPSFFVTFRSQALWRESAHLLHEKLLTWARAVGFVPVKPEGLSRVDFAFDYALPVVDFTEDHFVTRTNKDSQHRENGHVQTFTFGRDAIVLRVYDKVAEVEQQSDKVWFFVLWGQDRDVWRIEWQVRKDVLREFGIVTFEDLRKCQGDLLRYLCEEHTTLRAPNEDQNRSRWPVHPLWRALQATVRELDQLGVCRFDGKNAALEERLAQYARSVYGYLKAVAAVSCVRQRKPLISEQEALAQLTRRMWQLHDPLHWRVEVEKRIAEVQRGAW
ncbi:MAG TPA: hypothetical protein VMQ10_11615 [Spirochaetia bacterium]|nr:hypothetical protein [Spirochaetia bacterium]